ncbi:thioredoxin [Marinicella sp. W31]|uniref:thioredoxin n=1 Tax=Marinicella sp. W31 TaxID=3023713 RepID=UPI0037581B0A
MTEYKYDVTTDEFQNLVIERSSSLPVLVDFWADWCEPCKMLMPVLDNVLARFPESLYLAKVDTDKEQMLAMQLGIRSLPTVVLFKDGQPVANFMGVKPEAEIVAMLEPHVPVMEESAKVEDSGASSHIQALIDAEQWDAALHAASDMEGDQADLWRLRVFLAQKDGAQAQNCLDSFSDELKKTSEAAGLAARIKLLGLSAEASGDLSSAIEKLESDQIDVGIEQLLELLKHNNGDQGIRKTLIAAFDLLDDAKVVSAYRRRMAALVF